MKFAQYRYLCSVRLLMRDIDDLAALHGHFQSAFKSNGRAKFRHHGASGLLRRLFGDLLQARLMPFLIGTAVSLTSWYAALTLGVLGKTSASYFEILAYYAVAVVIVALALRWIRARLHGTAQAKI